MTLLYQLKHVDLNHRFFLKHTFADSSQVKKNSKQLAKDIFYQTVSELENKKLKKDILNGKKTTDLVTESLDFYLLTNRFDDIEDFEKLFAVEYALNKQWLMLPKQMMDINQTRLFLLLD